MRVKVEPSRQRNVSKHILLPDVHSIEWKGKNFMLWLLNPSITDLLKEKRVKMINLSLRMRNFRV